MPRAARVSTNRRSPTWVNGQATSANTSSGVIAPSCGFDVMLAATAALDSVVYDAAELEGETACDSDCS